MAAVRASNALESVKEYTELRRTDLIWSSWNRSLGISDEKGEDAGARSIRCFAETLPESTYLSSLAPTSTSVGGNDHHHRSGDSSVDPPVESYTVARFLH